MENDYIPFGEEYQKTLMRVTKKHLMDLFIKSAKKNLAIIELIDEMIEKKPNLFAYLGYVEALTELKQKIEKIDQCKM